MYDMICTESYESLDWPLVSGQFQTGLNVQLPGSEYLLPVQNGLPVDNTANLLQETKHLSKVDNFLDTIEEDDWDCFGDVGLPASGYFYDSDLVLDACGDSLPSSPEFSSFDEVVLGSDLDLYVKPCGYQAKAVPEDALDFGRLCDFDPTWLLLPIPILPSLEEVESVLSDSPPLDVISDEESLSPTGNETRSSEILFAPTPLHFDDARLENVQLSSSPLNIFPTNNIRGDNSRVATCSSIQVPQNVTWIDDSSLGQHSLGLYNGFFDYDNTSAIVTSLDSLSSLDSSHASSSSDFEDRSSSASPQPTRFSPVSVSPRVEPYPASGVRPERRERKREQNKTAALKYRHKKRSEQGVFVSECEQLERRNSELKGRAEELTREISYLKGLISEICSSQSE